MITFAIVLVIVTLLIAAYAVVLGRIVRHDGHRGPFMRIQPPRSHPRDMFDPALRF